MFAGGFTPLHGGAAVQYILPHLRLSCLCYGKKQLNEMEDHLGKSYSDSKELMLPGSLNSWMAVGMVDRRGSMVDELSFSRRYEGSEGRVFMPISRWCHCAAAIGSTRCFPSYHDHQLDFNHDIHLLERIMLKKDINSGFVHARSSQGRCVAMTSGRIPRKEYGPRLCTKTTGQRPASKSFDYINRRPASEQLNFFRNINPTERTECASTFFKILGSKPRGAKHPSNKCLYEALPNREPESRRVSFGSEKSFQSSIIAESIQRRPPSLRLGYHDGLLAVISTF
ncbi:hypothetical protein EV421DRAFT_1735971 [Armillaria borealis]|uniref:Uncharacterized protein n=1 Tax=Armillaria borealis TaxID=47425 RepID=A0AA39JM22_9AGAR|nr:hypothetical protein EV421DRAFT_1735971 [Armillaria borealis]